MRAATKMLMLTSARGNQGGNRGGRSEMEMGGSEMRGGYQGGQNEARNGGYGEMRGNYPREAYGRSEGEEMRGGYGRSEMGYGRSEMRRGGGRSEMEMGGYGQSEMEMRRGGGRSEMRGEGGQNRIGYEGGGNARSEMGEAESRRRYRRDSRGRFRSEMGEDMEQEMGMHYPMPYPFPPPIYEEEMRNPIGFSAEGGRAELHMIRGGAGGTKPLDKKTAEEWMENLQNEDGTKGPHWTMEQTTQVMKQKGIDCDPLEFWVAMNAVYSDYFHVAKKHNVNSIDFYAGMAKAFIEDKDSQPNRLARYYEYIAKH